MKLALSRPPPDEAGLLFSGAVMTLSPRNPKPPRPSSSASKPPLHHLLMELKHRILAALGKLADRDTLQIALDELEKILLSVSHDNVSVCLSCLYDSDVQQKSVVKRECVRLLASLASLHGDLLVPHLPKIIASITRRLRDPDSSVREACVDAMGVLSARMLSSSAPCGQENGAHAAAALTLGTFSKPLFYALCEQNKSVQTGAAMCLARVIESAKTPPLGAMARLCPRICKFMSNPNFLARAALLSVIGSLSQVGALGQQQLAVLMPCVHEALESTDWATRKAAAETLGRIASNLGPALACFKSSTLHELESCRFDKVKRVRDSVHDATQLWKILPGVEPGCVSSATKSDGPELAVSMQTGELRTPSPALKEMSCETAKIPVNDHTPELLTQSSPRLTKLSSEEPLAAVKKKVPNLADKKLNSNFFQKLDSRNMDDWQIEVSVPRTCPFLTSAATKVDLERVSDTGMDDFPKRNTNFISKTGQRSQVDEMCSHDSQLVSDSQGSEPEDRLHSTGFQSQSSFADENLVLGSRRTNNVTMSLGEAGMWLDKNLQKRAVENEVPEATGHGKSLSSNGSFKESLSSNVGANWHSIHKQLSQLEHQQASLVQMVQDCMASSQESIFTLQARVRGLERTVEDMVLDLGYAGERRVNGLAGEYENNRIRPTGKYFFGHDYTSCKSGKGIESCHPFAERVPESESMNSGIRGMLESTYKSSEPASEDWDDYTYAKFRGSGGTYLVDGQFGPRKCNIGVVRDPARVVKDDVGLEQMLMRKVWDGATGPVRLGEGPSARSVWQASKDEATLAAIRVAGEDASVSEVEALSTGASRLVTPESSESMSYKNNGSGKGQYWSLWGSALEFVHAGDVESAYVEVLCNEDELMLVRLMSRTGPVLDQLSSSTGSEVLCAAGHLLQQQSYLDCCLAWIQQLADMVVDSGGDCVELSQDAKKVMLLSLQDAVSMDLPEGWLGNSVDQLLQQLGNAWCIDVEQVGGEL